MNFPNTTLLLSLVVISSCDYKEQSYQLESSKQWYKGNLHTHSYWSDGDEFPEMIMDWYKSNGYDFVALSDHNILGEGDKWKKISSDSLYQDAFDRYLEKYGSDWVEFTRDSSGLRVKLKTFQEYKPLFEDQNRFLILQAEEITDEFLAYPIHVNATNIQALIDPQGGESVVEVLQNNIDAVLKQREETGVPIVPHVNHPNFRSAISLQDMVDITGERFFEVYNGHPIVDNYGDSSALSTEQMWDYVNIAYLEKKQPLLYGIATDDTHNYHLSGSAYSNAGRGWIMVNADSLDATSLLESMENGRFYASTGVDLKEVTFQDNELTVAVEAKPGVNYEIQFIGVRAPEQVPSILKQVMGDRAIFEIAREVLFVRAKVISDKPQSNPFQEGDVEVAWTQPVTPDR